MSPTQRAKNLMRVENFRGYPNVCKKEMYNMQIRFPKKHQKEKSIKVNDQIFESESNFSLKYKKCFRRRKILSYLQIY